MSGKSQFKLFSFILAGTLAFGSSCYPVYAGETNKLPTDDHNSESEEVSSSDGAEDADSSGNTSRVLLPSAGFSYSFSANKVSLQDVQDHLNDTGVISGKKTTDMAATSTASDSKSAAATTLTPVQKQEKAVVQAVSETQGIEIDNATATILSATAVTVISEPTTAVSLAKLADKKQTQAKLDQGLITAGEAEALMAANQASTSITVNVGENQTEESTEGATEVVISIAPGTGETDTGAADGGTSESVVLEAVSAETGDGTETAGDAAGSDVASSETEFAGTGSADGSEIKAEDNQMEDNSSMGNSSGDSADSSESPDTAVDSGTAGNSNTAPDSSSVPGSSASQAATDSNGNELVVAQVNDYINIRSDADPDSDIVGKLYNGSVARVMGRTGNGWARIESGDVKGYIREEYVATGETAQKMADSAATKQATVNTETLRVRAAAEGDSDVITLIGEGQTFDILGEENGWYKVSTPDGEGYISSDFADVENVYPEAVSKQQEEAEEAAKKAEEEAATKAASDAAAASSESDASTASSDDSGSESQSSGTASGTGTDSDGSSGSSGSGNALNSYTGSSSSGTSAGQAVVNYAMQFIGNPYVWGGSSLTNGTDCSGFTMAVYANFGYSLPHYTGSQESCGTAVASLADAQPGDLILYDGHVGIYMGNNQIVHASNPRTGITTGIATYRHIVAIRRIIN